MDPTLTIALVFAIGMAARFYLRTLDMGRRNAALEADREFSARRVKQQDATIAELLDKLEATESALHRAIDREVPRGAA